MKTTLHTLTALLLMLVAAGLPLQAAAQTIQLTGTVVEAGTDEPLIGASVSVKGTRLAAATDIDGAFVIKGVDPKATIVVSYVSYKTREIALDGRSQITVELTPDNELLEEVVVIGYGTMDKKELTSAISHVGEKDFLSVSSLDPSMLIQGKVPGVSITNTGSADPNNQASIQIRGVSSRSAGLGPLIVIDGVPGGNLTNINANDIASFDVLKDGAASAIYGTRGSNGVILVTTKKGTKDGAIHTSYSGTFAWDKIKKELDMMNAQEYRDVRLGWGDNGVDLGGNYDWLDGVSRTGFAHHHTLSLSGGNDRSNYRVSVDYRDTEVLIFVRVVRSTAAARLCRILQKAVCLISPSTLRHVSYIAIRPTGMCLRTLWRPTPQPL